ncbi:MAG: nuclear transport factor 2 family protein [Coleofasciculaceae cyanobacterium SM2_1_6]|nr:nuclear transport factor 2 family protein [Coleofasciculaceae cyanobacterium SM2_1_6]
MHNSVQLSLKSSLRWSWLLLITLGMNVGVNTLTIGSAAGETLPPQPLNFSLENFPSSVPEVNLASTRETVPPELSTILSQVDTAANNRELNQLMLFYTASFTNSDDLNREQMLKALEDLWKRYPNLTYRTEIQSWERRPGGFLIETVTTITGMTEEDGTPVKFQSVLRSRQVIDNLRISSQEILAERTQTSLGNNPPTVTINLPEQVQVGQRYSFDAIVQEPLGDDLLLGTALEEPVSSDRYLNPTNLELNLLQSGGIFRVGRAPLRPESRWISAVLIRGSGTTVITQRLRVVD